MTTQTLKIPYGLSDWGEVVSATLAQKGVKYMCPSCKSHLTLRDGQRRTKHFAHSTDAPCSQESVLHKTAKMLIEQIIHQHARKEGTITIHKPCDKCTKECIISLPDSAFTKASQEVGVGGFICDVMAYRNKKPVLAIEVRHTHAVDSHKATTLSVHWLEVDAESIIDNPFEWHTTQSRLKPTYCRHCKKSVRQIIDACDAAGIPRYLYTTSYNPKKSTFVASTETCYNCKKDTPVFWWRGTPFDKNAPAFPRPESIVKRFSNTYGDEYWMNTCVHCSASQGDNFLHTMPDGVFADLPHHDYTARQAVKTVYRTREYALAMENIAENTSAIRKRLVRWQNK